jgi:drug/metabolite transporter (DMT)-like permease
MPMPLAWLSLAVVSTIGYHVVIKLTPAAVNPLLSLAVTYALVTLVCVAGAFWVADGVPVREAARHVNWTALGLAVVIVGLDLGFLMLYRGGFDVSLGQIVTQAGAALGLVLLGVLAFRERIGLAQVAGIVLCVAGIWLISRR